MSRLLLWMALLTSATVVAIGASLQSVWLRDRVLTFALDAGTEQWSLDAVEGRLLTGLVLQGLDLEAAGVKVSIRRLEVRPALERILFGQIALKALLIDDVDLTLPTAPAEAGPEAEPAAARLPLPVVLDDFALRGFRLNQGGDEVLRDLDLTLTLQGRHQTLDIDQLNLHWPAQGLLVHGRANVDLAPPYAFGATLDVQRRDPAGDLPALQTRLVATGDVEQVGLAATLHGDIQGTALAQWNLADNRGRVRGEVSALAWEGLPPELAWQRLEFDAEGSPEALAWEVAFDAGWEDLQPRLVAYGSVQQYPQGVRLHLAHAELAVDANTVAFNGDLQLSEPFGFEAELTASSLDLAPWLADFPTRLDVSATLDGQIGSQANERRLNLRRVAINGHWNEAPARLRAAAAMTWPSEQPALQLDRFELEVGDNQIEGRGELTTTLNLDLDIGLGDLEQLWPDAAGTVRGSVSARGTTEAPDLTFDLEIHELAWGELSLARGGLDGRFDLASTTRTHLEADLEGLRSGNLLYHATAAVEGTWPHLGADVTVDIPDVELTMTAAATANMTLLRQAEIQSLTIEQRLAGHWQLEQALQISRSDATPTVLSWSPACLFGDSIGQPRLCLAAGYLSEQGLHLDASLSDLAVETFAPLLPRELQTHGVIRGQARLRGTDLDVSLDVDGGRFRILDPVDQDEVFADAISHLRLALQQRGTKLEAGLQAEAELVGTLDVSAEIELTEGRALEHAPLNATVRLDMADLTPFGPLIPTVGDTAGTLVGDMAIGGRVGDPEFSGNVELVGRAEILALALELDPITLDLTATAGQPAVLRGRFHAGSQVLEIDAEAEWDMADGLVASGRLQGDALPLAALPDLNLTLSPDLRFAIDDSSVRLSGSATIPEAKARIRALPQGGGDTLSQDVVIHRTAAEVAAQRQRDRHLNLTVILGNSVELAAGGLQTRLTGRLQLLESPGAPLTAQGRLETREGSFNAYGQELELRTGRLNFDGPLDNPAVDVLAVRRVNGAEVGVRVGGFLNTLETRLYSSPARGDVDTLTMLITGRMPGEASSADLANVSDAALNFGIGQAVPVVGRLVNRLGIDELAVDSPLDEDAGAVIVGTRLTDDIYVRYTYGLHSRLGGLQVEYRVTDWMSIQSETGTTQAIDVIFRREFN